MFISFFQLLIHKNRNLLYKEITEEKAFEIFLFNFCILINNLVKEFIIHIKEFYENIHKSLINENMLKVFIETHNSLVKQLKTKFNKNTSAFLHFLYLNPKSKHFCSDLFRDINERIDFNKAHSYLHRIELRLIEDICS